MTLNEIFNSMREHRDIARGIFIKLNEDPNVSEEMKEFLSPIIEELLDDSLLMELKLKFLERQEHEQETIRMGQAEAQGKLAL